MEISDEEFKNICEASISMAEAARNLNLTLKTFRKRAKILGVYKPNQGGKGSNKPSKNFYPLEKVFTNELPLQSYRLKQRLYKANLKKNQCEICGISEWNNLPIECHLDHIDGCNTNNTIENLRLLCPNCHSLTPTYCGKNKGKYKK
jgi:hypothetical protein